MNKSREEELLEAVLKAVEEADGTVKLACADAFRLAEELGARPGEVVRICNRRNIRITKCQLGCF